MIPPFITPFLPMIYRWLAIIAVGLALFGFGYFKAAGHYKAEIQEMKVAAMKEGVRIAATRTVVTEKIITKWLPQIERQHVITETHIKEVPVYVPRDTPSLPPGFRVLIDAAAAGSVPDPASIPHAAPVGAQAATASIVDNYGTCRADQARLRGLQDWVTEQGKVK